uniref:Cellular repressor of E1A-stimulated genes 2 n=1 Tax=Hucho hucho TaxID=62062 RepID=A0A4W5LYX1_9TELE
MKPYHLSLALFAATLTPPPPHQETARTARYMAQYSDWGHLATISTQDKLQYYITISVMAQRTTVLYFYITPMDNTVADLRSFPFASLTFSEAEVDFCRENRECQMYDPVDPRCARLTLTGKMVEVDPEEVDIMLLLVLSLPVMKKWPVGHNWFIMKLQLTLTQVWLQDWVGGVSLIPLEDYFKATPY